MSEGLVSDGHNDALRDAATEAISVLITDRDQIDQPLDIDFEKAKGELNDILDTHAGAIAELTVNGAFDLIEMQAGAGYDVGRYTMMLKTIDTERLIAESEAIAEGAESRVGRIVRRRELVLRLAYVSQAVARGLLVTVIARGLAGGGVAIPVNPTA